MTDPVIVPREPTRDEVEAFLLEDATDSRTLSLYLERYPDHAEALLDLAHDIAFTEFSRHAPPSSDEDDLIAKGWATINGWTLPPQPLSNPQQLDPRLVEWGYTSLDEAVTRLGELQADMNAFDGLAEAPKVEQEPCAKCRGLGYLMWEGGDSTESVTEYEDCPSCTHPAPSSDELLSINRIASAALRLCAEGYKPEETAKRSLKALSKYKGPQS